MMLAVIDYAIIFASSGLLVYWFSRAVLLLHGAHESIEETLDCDAWWGRRLLLLIRSMIEPPQLLG
jgi:hypothetical protein